MNTLLDWKEDLINEIIKVEQKGGFKREETKIFFQLFADKHNLAYNTVRLNYYKIKKELTNTTLPENKDEYLDVVVASIAPYGVFTTTEDDEKRSGLIHVSEVKDCYIEDLHRYFKVGDKLHARVVQSDTGKLALSVTHLTLPDYFLEKEKEVTMAPQPLTVTEASFKSTPEVEAISDYLTKLVGFMSPNAKKMLEKIIIEHGMFKFSLALAKVEPSFDNDLGMLLMSQIENHIGDYL